MGLGQELVGTLVSCIWVLAALLALARLILGVLKRHASWPLAVAVLALVAAARGLTSGGGTEFELAEAALFAIVLGASLKAGRPADAGWLRQDSFTTLAENLPAVFVVKDLERRYLYVNSMFLRWHATTLDKVIGRTRRDIAAPYTSVEDEALETRAIEDRAPRSVEVRQHFPDGVTRNTLIVKFPIATADGDIRYLGGVSLDVTEHRQALEALKRSERRYRSVIDNVTDGVLVLDADLQVVEVNAAACRAFGYTRKEMLAGATPSIADHAGLHAALVDGQPRRITGTLRRKDGSAFPAEIAIGSGEWDGKTMLVATVRDVSERHRIEEELHRSESWLSAIVENMPAEVYLKDLDFHYVFVNRRLSELFACPPDRLIGKVVHDLHPRATAEYAERMDRQVLETGQSVAYEDFNSYPDGSSRTILITKFPVFDAGGRAIGIGGINIDISDRKRVEIALREAKEQAELASRTKSEFLANVSHELRTPLNSIIGFSDMMRSEILGPIGNQRYREYAGDINDAGAHLLKLINDILDLSRIEIGGMSLDEEPIDVAELLEGCRRLIEPRVHAARLSITVDCPATLPGLVADKRRVRQILINLLSNACKFTREGGSVRLAAESSPQSSIALVVEDTGIGIAETDIAKVLAPFGQVDGTYSRRFEGVGLGLPLSKRLVEMHGGTLTIASTIGVGTRVIVTFPPERSIGGRRRSPNDESVITH